jgi:hypothetical protein
VGLIGAEGAALVQHGVNQGGLSVVHVRDDGDVAKTLAQNLMSFLLGKPPAIRQTEGFGTGSLSLQYAAQNGFTTCTEVPFLVKLQALVTHLSIGLASI